MCDVFGIGRLCRNRIVEKYGADGSELGVYTDSTNLAFCLLVSLQTLNKTACVSV